MISYMNCCGVKELANINKTPVPKTIKDLTRNFVTGYSYTEQRWGLNGTFTVYRKRVAPQPQAPFLIFTDHANKSQRGYELAEYIRTNGLGNVTETPPKHNPNSENYVVVWTWEVDWTAFEAHVGKTRKQKHGMSIRP